ncbi:hypothetical protein [Streptomyces aureoversilis]|uniref:Uncharacterized protein n=1 Tax=Streptomyces aureoversilis TaxID=67277 RepID=A0ABV9ZUY4_9ACTN
MAWDAKKAIAEYREGECDNPRCLNRLHALDKQRTELLDAHGLLSKIMQRAKEHCTDSQTAREIYTAIAHYNLGRRDHGAELPRLPSNATDSRGPA